MLPNTFHTCSCCVFSRTLSEEEDSVAGMAAVVARSKRKETPPPPYEDPPSYSVAIQMETLPTLPSLENNLSTTIFAVT